ncbi:MAG TPA: universal stress protein [Stellaceae bacterium]|nr:universal stress protein [Stellaceae bacterium]
MTIKTILAAASGGSASAGAIELACRFARRFGAHVEGFHARPDPRDLFAYSGDGFGMSMSGEFVDRFVKDAEEIASKTKSSFETIAKRHQIAVGSMPSQQLPGKIAATATWHEETGYGPTLVSRRARFFDLTVLGRSERVVDQPHTDVVEQTLVHSGRPVLLAPAKTPEAFGDNIVAGWNGSAEATRALAAALPFLGAAQAVTIVTIGEKHQESSAALIEYLGWHDIKAKHRHVPAVSGVGPGQQLLSAAREESADLLVMGGYGHLPWREFLFGGATREVVGVSLLPLLLSH